MIEGRSKKVVVVALAGMPGAGKSSLARYLADELDLAMVDLDEEIAKMEGSSLTEIFSRYGESGFRDREVHQLAQSIEASPGEPLLLALGGGTGVVDERSAKLLHKSARVIYIWCTPDLLEESLGTEEEKAKRPLLAQGDLRPHLERLYAARHPRYLELADAILGPDLSWAELRSGALAKVREWLEEATHPRVEAK